MTAPAAAAAPLTAIFTQGSTMRHVIVMTSTGCIGLMALFLVDLLSIFYVTLLRDEASVAAVGYAAQLNFFLFSFSIGMTIAVGALVSRALGAGERERARRLAVSGLVFAAAISALLVAAAYPFRHPLLYAIGARGAALETATAFLGITLPANILMALGLVMSGILRAVGDPRRAMYITLSGGIATAFTDPLFIFLLGFGVYGAAIAIVVSRAVFVVVGAYGAVRVHDLVARPRAADLRPHAWPIFVVAGPAVLTNLATPVANVYATHILAGYGQATVAGVAIMDRIVPVAFGAVFALSAAVGPIIGQNLGARRLDRVRQTLSDSFAFIAVYVLTVWLVLYLTSGVIAAQFSAVGDTRTIVIFYCTYGVAAWLFVGWLFVANAAFNNLGYALLSTLFNWGRTTLGTIPFVTLGAGLYGARGAVLGIVAGSAVFGTAALLTAFATARRLAAGTAGVLPSVPAPSGGSK